MDFKNELKSRAEAINALLDAYLPPVGGYQKTCVEAMRYAVEGGGKRLRPMLMKETFRLFGGEGSVVEPFMAAIEMIHSYSLVHDDLPAMDNDRYRRGKLSTHAAFGEAMGILAGDGLLNFAFETAGKAFDTEMSPRTAKAFQVLAQKAGIYGMVGGQVADVENEGKPVSPELLDFIFENKTGALIEASMMIGAILAGTADDKVKKIERAASLIGKAFQIRDDILDVTSTTETLGKPVGSDEKNEKTTYVTLYGLEKAEKDVRALSCEALDILDGFEGKNEFLMELVGSLVGREK